MVKAAGDLAPQAVATVDGAEDAALAAEAEADGEGEKALTNAAEAAEGSGLAEAGVDIEAYRPTILPNRQWKLSEVDLGGCPLCVDCGMKYVCTDFCGVGRRVDRGGMCDPGHGRGRVVVPAVLDVEAGVARGQGDPCAFFLLTHRGPGS